MKKMSLNKIYIRFEQIVLLLPLLYLLSVSGSNVQIMQRDLLTSSFELGLSLLPRVTLFLLSLLYRLSRNEVLLYFAFIGIALLIGMIFAKKEAGDRWIILFLLSDLLLRPFGFRRLSLPWELLSILIRIAVLSCFLLKRKRKNEESSV